MVPPVVLHNRRIYTGTISIRISMLEADGCEVCAAFTFFEQRHAAHHSTVGTPDKQEIYPRLSIVCDNSQPIRPSHQRRRRSRAHADMASLSLSSLAVIRAPIYNNVSIAILVESVHRAVRDNEDPILADGEGILDQLPL